jgi:APA family basic amino acid/polyamine antiporter
VGQTIGAGIFALTGIALAQTGPSLFLAFIAASIPVAISMVVLAMLASAHPISGGTYFYGSRFFSPVLSFAGVSAYILGALLGMFPLYALTGAGFLKAVFPSLPKLPVAICLLLTFYVMNLLGVKIAMLAQVAMVGVLLCALFMFIGVGIPQVSVDNIVPLFPKGIAGFAMASSLLTFTLLGANAAVELGDEIVEPRRNIPLSFLISIPLVVTVYVLVGIVAAGAAKWDSLGNGSLEVIAKHILGGAPDLFFVLGGGFLAVVTTLNATFLWGTRSLIIVTEDGYLPKRLAAVNKRLGTPHSFLTIVFAFAALSLCLIGERIEIFAIFASLGGIIIFLPVMGAALKLSSSHPEVYLRSALKLRGAFYFLAPAVGIILCLIVVAVLLIDLLSHTDGLVFLIIFICWLMAGVLYASFKKKQLL